MRKRLHAVAVGVALAAAAVAVAGPGGAGGLSKNSPSADATFKSLTTGTVDAGTVNVSGSVITPALDAGTAFFQGIAQFGVANRTIIDANGFITQTGGLSGLDAASTIYTDLLRPHTTNGNIGLGQSTGTETFNGPVISYTATGITAHAGGGQGSATALAADFSRVDTVATTADSVLLPTCTVGRVVHVINNSKVASRTLNIYPASGGQIDALGANAAYALASATTATSRGFRCVDGSAGATAWSSF